MTTIKKKPANGKKNTPASGRTTRKLRKAKGSKQRKNNAVSAKNITQTNRADVGVVVKRANPVPANERVELTEKVFAATNHVVMPPIPAAEIERRSEWVRRESTDGADDPRFIDTSNEPLWGQKLLAAVILAALAGSVLYWWLS